MLKSPRQNIGLTGRTVRKAIALLQVLVLLALALPVCALEQLAVHETADINRTAETEHDSQEGTPCCPDESQPESGSNTCSTCSYCTIHMPMTSQVSASYSPCISPLIVPERLTRLPEVHIPILVPPQNLL